MTADATGHAINFVAPSETADTGADRLDNPR
jgi:hypothetical protein